ncbi:MAG: hypothetical protein ABSD38_33850 [Syntrophorhabdales bacterium]|jgi:hypothetical protein
MKPIEATCSYSVCGKIFIYKDGRAHFDRAKRHYCCPQHYYDRKRIPTALVFFGILDRLTKDGKTEVEIL